MSAYGHSDNTNQRLRQIKRQMSLLDLRLQLLRHKLLAECLRRSALQCCCRDLPDPQTPGKKNLLARMDVGRQRDRTKSLSRTLNSSHDQNCLALVDVKDFDPKDVVVTVKDKKVIVFAERRDECNTSGKKTCNYRRLMKEFNLPPGVRENKVTFSLEPNNILKIEMTPKSSPCLKN